MQVVAVAVHRDGHAGVRDAERKHLRFTQRGGKARIRITKRRDLHEVEGKIALAPMSAPVGNHRWKEAAILFGAANVALALIPDRAADTERNDRRKHRVEQ